MPEITTISVAPDRAKELREIRDQRDLRSMDEALEAVLNRARSTQNEGQHDR